MGTVIRTAMEEADMYFRWYGDMKWTFVPAQAVTARFLGTFEEFPQRQALPSFNLDAIPDKLGSGAPGGN